VIHIGRCSSARWAQRRADAATCEYSGCVPGLRWPPAQSWAARSPRASHGSGSSSWTYPSASSWRCCPCRGRGGTSAAQIPADADLDVVVSADDHDAGKACAHGEWRKVVVFDPVRWPVLDAQSAAPLRGDPAADDSLVRWGAAIRSRDTAIRPDARIGAAGNRVRQGGGGIDAPLDC
jgi:hypothetical protein